jgi:predicted sulfurtransferase
MIKDQIQHFDKLGTEIFPGDFIAAPHGHSQILIAQVIKLNPKMLSIKSAVSNAKKNTYARETVKINPELVTMYILRNKK